MQKRKTQRWYAGLQGEFNFMRMPSSSATQITQQATMCGYLVDSQNIVSAMWRRLQ